jgi:hypothetical protein
MNARGKKLRGVHALKCGGGWAEENTLQSLCALGEAGQRFRRARLDGMAGGGGARRMGADIPCTGRGLGYTGPAIHRQQLHQVHRCAGGGKGGP